MEVKDGGWVFLSHSHRDIRRVRLIRNELERRGFEPLLFFMKCLTDEDEITDLIKREIDAREWFIYVDSANARASNWVKTERDHIEKLTGKHVFTIDLSMDVDRQLQEIARITRQMKVFVSCANSDQALLSRIRDKLLVRELLVLTQDQEQALDVACRDGFVLLMITEESMNSGFVLREIRKAMQEKAKIVPVYVGNARINRELLPLIGDLQGVRIGETPTDGELDKVVDSILHHVEYYDNDYTTSYGYRGAVTIHLPPISRIDNLTFFDCENLQCVYIPDSVIYITPDAFADHPHILVRCGADSYALRYCRKKGIRYEIVEM